LEDLGVDEKII